MGGRGTRSCIRVHSMGVLALCTTTMVYGVLVHHQAAICTTEAQYAPWCTRETIFFEKFRVPCLSVCLSVMYRGPLRFIHLFVYASHRWKPQGNVKLHFYSLSLYIWFTNIPDWLTFDATKIGFSSSGTTTTQPSYGSFKKMCQHHSCSESLMKFSLWVSILT